MRGFLGGRPGRLVGRKETRVHPELLGHSSCTSIYEVVNSAAIRCRNIGSGGWPKFGASKDPTLYN